MNEGGIGGTIDVRTRKPTRTGQEDLSKPSQWRLQHGTFEPRSFDADPDTGVVVGHHRAVDTLGMMLLSLIHI